MSEISKLTADFIKEIQKYDSIADSYLDEILDVTDTIGEVIGPIKALNTIYKKVQLERFKYFLKSFSHRMKDSKNREVLEKLELYLKNERNSNFIYETIDAAIHSKCKKCSYIIGYFCSKLLINEIDIGFKELVIINALKNLNDIELEHTIQILKMTPPTMDKRSLYQRGIQEYTIEKLKTLQILEEGESGTFGSQLGWGFYIKTELSEDFQDLIIDSGVLHL